MTAEELRKLIESIPKTTGKRQFTVIGIAEGPQGSQSMEMFVIARDAEDAIKLAREYIESDRFSPDGDHRLISVDSVVGGQCLHVA